jgi:hypothetical protein
VGTESLDEEGLRSIAPCSASLRAGFHFAGEGTIGYFSDSVHGTYLSGRREAAGILTPVDAPDELDAVIVEDVTRELRRLASPIGYTR